jgi:YbbR domain-containing protein
MAIRPFRNLALKLVSVVLAALLWLIVSGEQTVERVLRIPLEFTNIPSELELVGEPPTVVDVRVRGSSGALGRLSSGDLAAVLDVRTPQLDDPRAGQRLYHLTGADVRAPFGLEVMQISPASIALSFEPSATRSVPVMPIVEGSPAQGFTVGTIVSDPTTVVVVGPASALKVLSGAVTEAISVEGATETVTESVTVGLADPVVRLLEPQTARVTVSIVPEP